jgi:hypothetical protein
VLIFHADTPTASQTDACYLLCYRPMSHEDRDSITVYIEKYNKGACKIWEEGCFKLLFKFYIKNNTQNI